MFMTDTKLSDAEEVALDTMWHRQGFVDAGSPEFKRFSRYYQWRINIAAIIGLVLVVICLAFPNWVFSHLQIRGAQREWFSVYVEFRSAMAATVLVVGTYCWLRNVGMKTFWKAFTLLTICMLILDFQVASSLSETHTFSPSPAWLVLRLSLIAIGIANIWHGAYAPAKRVRHVLSLRGKHIS